MKLHCRTATSCIFAVTIGFASAGGLHAQSSQVPADPVAALADRVTRLEQQLDNVQQQNVQLRQRLGEVSAAPAVSAQPRFPEIRLNVLGSIEYAFNNAPDEPNGMALGDIDLVTTARVNDHAGVTSDYVIASDHGGFVYEIERLFVSYKFNDAFNLDVGRFHAAMGWYNNFYHNGTYFQTTRSRPDLMSFEDDSGLLPVHGTGLSLNGDIPSGSANLSYSVEVTNGRDYTADSGHALQIEDDNDFKAFNFQLRAKPDALANWQLGVGAYHDTLTPVLDPENTPDATTRVDQWILTGFAIYKTPVIEWFTETALVGDEPVGGDRHWTFAGYTQVSHKFGKFRPYVRYQWEDAAHGDPVLQLIDRSASMWDVQFGVRYDFTTMMALKFEFDHAKPQDESSTDEFSSQLSFRF